MKTVARIVCIAALLLLAGLPVAEAGTRKCSSAPGACERQIRAMLEGKPAPLGFVVRTASGGRGVVVHSVTPDGPAARAGLAAGDRIMSFESHDVSKSTLTELNQVREKVMAARAMEPGTGKIVMTISRIGSFKRLSLRLEVMSEEQIDRIVAAHLREAHGIEHSAEKTANGSQQR
jgi:C-terminal processing protease CtpA/Prc